MFSEDGLHPNSRGYAFTANVIIDAINTAFSANIPKAKLSNFAGTGLPAKGQ
jgi:lysophospholipase L1-like esterase